MVSMTAYMAINTNKRNHDTGLDKGFKIKANKTRKLPPPKPSFNRSNVGMRGSVKLIGVLDPIREGREDIFADALQGAIVEGADAALAIPERW